MGGYRNNCPPGSGFSLPCTGNLSSQYRVTIAGVADFDCSCGALNAAFDIGNPDDSLAGIVQYSREFNPDLVCGTDTDERIIVRFECSGSDTIISVIYQYNYNDGVDFYTATWRATVSSLVGTSVNETLPLNGESGVQKCNAFGSTATVVSL